MVKLSTESGLRAIRNRWLSTESGLRNLLLQVVRVQIMDTYIYKPYTYTFMCVNKEREEGKGESKRFAFSEINPMCKIP